MHGQDTTTIEPGDYLHIVYCDMAGAITERVVRVREVCADGEGFKGYCLRRIADGGEGRRLFLFERIRYCRNWRGGAIKTCTGRVLVPSYAEYRRYAQARRAVAG